MIIFSGVILSQKKLIIHYRAGIQHYNNRK